jgi:hypothetical protein
MSCSYDILCRSLEKDRIRRIAKAGTAFTHSRQFGCTILVLLISHALMECMLGNASACARPTINDVRGYKYHHGCMPVLPICLLYK